MEKVVIYNPLGNSKGHSKIYASGIVNGFLKREIDTILITSADFDSSFLETDNIKIEKTKKVTNKNINTSTKINKLNYGFFLLENTLTSFKRIKKYNNNKNIILIIGGDTLFNTILLLFTVNKKNIGLTIHNSDYELSIYKNDPIKFIYKALSKIFIKLLTFSGIKIFCHGKYTAKVLEQQLRAKPGRIKNYLVPIVEKKQLTRREKTSEFNLLFFGIIRYDKGLDILIKALNFFEGKRFKLYVCGSTSQMGEEKVKKILLRSNRYDRIITDFGYLEEDKLEYYFSKATYVVLPYRKTFRAQSVVFTDSLKRHVPVISSIESQNGFDTSFYKVGETFESENIKSLTHAINAAYSKWERKNLPDTKNFKKYLKSCSPVEISKQISNAFF